MCMQNNNYKFFLWLRMCTSSSSFVPLAFDLYQRIPPLHPIFLHANTVLDGTICQCFKNAFIKKKDAFINLDGTS